MVIAVGTRLFVNPVGAFDRVESVKLESRAYARDYVTVYSAPTGSPLFERALLEEINNYHHLARIKP